MTDTTQYFQWTGIDNQGKRDQGSIQANDVKEAQHELKKMGIEVISIAPKIKFQLPFFSRRKKVKTKDIVIFTRYMSTMITAGLTIPQALDIISADQENPSMKSFLIVMRNNITSGKTLSESFSQYPEYFSDLYSNLVKAGEKSGSLDKVFMRLGNYLERTEALKRKVKKALIYPSAIIVVAIIVSLILLIFVVPQFDNMFKTFGASLPMFTRMVVNMSHFIRQYWWLIFGCIFFSVWGIRRLLRTNEKIKQWLDRWSLRVILFGTIIRKSIIARFTRTLATTMDAGMPIVESLKSMSLIMGNELYKKAVIKICDDVTSGHQLSASMSSTKLFPNMVIQMIAVGEASGRLADMLNKVADYYEEDVNHIVDNLSSLLEPLIMAMLGVIIGGFVVAMYLPIFRLGSLF